MESLAVGRLLLRLPSCCAQEGARPRASSSPPLKEAAWEEGRPGKSGQGLLRG